MKTSIVTALILWIFVPVLALAQDPAVVKRAGNELKFRVIPRFEDAPAPQTDPFPAAAEWVERGEWPKAWAAVEKTEPTTPEGFFLKGYIALKASRPEALGLLDKASKADAFVLNHYASRFAAEAARSEGKHDQALKYASQVGPGLPVSDDAQWLAILSLQASKKPGEAAAALAMWLEKHPRDSRVPTARLMYARLVLPTDPEIAATQAYAILIDSPLDSLVGQARNVLSAAVKKLPKARQKAFDPSSAQAKMARWRALYRSHRSQDVVDEIGKVAAKLPESQWCEGNFLVAHSLTKLRKHADSAIWYKKVIDRCSSSDWRIRSLYLGGKASWNAGQRADARAMFERVWTDYKTHSYADDAMYFTARILEEDGDDKGMAALVAKQTAAYPEGDMTQDAHWLEIRRLFKLKRYDEALTRIDAIKVVNEPDLYSRGRLSYFRARALELGGHADQALVAYAKTVRDFPVSYYALLAFQRLGKDVTTPWLCPGSSFCDVPTVASPEITPGDLSDPSYLRAQMLFALHLSTLARAEILTIEARVAKDPNALWYLADQLDRAGAYTFSHDIARRQIPGWDHAYPDPTQRRSWEIGFPRPFEDFVKANAKTRGISPALIWAIMREESGFNPRIESWANARGLLQLMEGTGERMAKIDHMSFTGDTLFDASSNVRLGSRYLQELGESVEVHPVLMIAGYNGGMGNVGRWLKEADSPDLDLMIEDIPFGQTRNYTKRVLLSFWVYSWLYGEGQVPRFSMTLPAQK
jgi:soluble lytic murein transglycosylase